MEKRIMRGARLMEEVDLPTGFNRHVGTHIGGNFIPWKRARVQVLDNGEEQLELVLFIPFDHLGGR